MLATIEDVKRLLSEGKKLILAADEKLLLSLPKGRLDRRNDSILHDGRGREGEP